MTKTLTILSMILFSATALQAESPFAILTAQFDIHEQKNRPARLMVPRAEREPEGFLSLEKDGGVAIPIQGGRLSMDLDKDSFALKYKLEF